MVKKIVLLFLCLDIVILVAVYIPELESYLHPSPTADPNTQNWLQIGPTSIQLTRDPFAVLIYPAKKNPPLALILFASGDGGWNHWEDNICKALQAGGYTVIGIDSNAYARTDYDLATLQADFDTIAQHALAAYPGSSVPVILGGWSMGAAQCIAAAGGPHPPKGLVGVLTISPLSRGRYGLRISDRVDILPTGPGTFAIADFAPGMTGLRIAQWHGQSDTIDSTAWLADLKTAHREFDFPADHYFGEANPEFQRQLVDSVAWILNSTFSQ